MFFFILGAGDHVSVHSVGRRQLQLGIRDRYGPGSPGLGPRGSGSPGPGPRVPGPGSWVPTGPGPNWPGSQDSVTKSGPPVQKAHFLLVAWAPN